MGFKRNILYNLHNNPVYLKLIKVHIFFKKLMQQFSPGLSQCSVSENVNIRTNTRHIKMKDITELDNKENMMGEGDKEVEY